MRLTQTLSALAAAGVLLAAPEATAAGAFLERFERPLERSGWRISDYSHPGRWLDTRWEPGRILERPGGPIVIELLPEAGGEKAFLSAEARRRASTRHGRYEVILQAAKGAGLNTAFFTYTGPHRNEPHDEIDFEFLGRSPRTVWINVFVDGQAQLGFLADLGFDASEALHLYAFEWEPERIRWFADGRLLHEYRTGDGPMPTTPGQIYISLWAGHPSLESWLGRADPATTARARYACVSFVPAGGSGAQCSDGWQGAPAK